MDMNLVALRDFRDDFSACLYRRVDALFALAEALLTAGAVPSPVHLSGEPTHRRGWGSLYVALVHGRLDETGLRVPLATQPLAEGQPVYAVDCSVQARCDAVASPERGFYYHPSRHSAGQPIVAGWSYQWLAQVGFAHESWTALLDVRRVHPSEHANGVAVAQVARLVRRLPTDGPVPLFVFDAGYDAVVLQRGLADQRASILVRLRSGRCCYGTPPSLPPRPQRGRPFRHGQQARVRRPGDVADADRRARGRGRAIRCGAGPRLGRAPPEIAGPVGAWHERALAHRAADPGPRRGLSPAGRPYPPQVLWLWWHGPPGATPDRDLLWRAYVRHFDLEHICRFIKQTLGWHTLRVRHPEQADRWTWLALTAYTQLRLARALVADRRLPWERRPWQLPDASRSPHHRPESVVPVEDQRARQLG